MHIIYLGNELNFKMKDIKAGDKYPIACSHECTTHMSKFIIDNNLFKIVDLCMSYFDKHKSAYTYNRKLGIKKSPDLTSLNIALLCFDIVKQTILTRHTIPARKKTLRNKKLSYSEQISFKELSLNNMLYYNEYAIVLQIFLQNLGFAPCFVSGSIKSAGKTRPYSWVELDIDKTRIVLDAYNALPTTVSAFISNVAGNTLKMYTPIRFIQNSDIKELDKKLFTPTEGRVEYKACTAENTSSITYCIRA